MSMDASQINTFLKTISPYRNGNVFSRIELFSFSPYGRDKTYKILNHLLGKGLLYRRAFRNAEQRFEGVEYVFDQRFFEQADLPVSADEANQSMDQSVEQLVRQGLGQGAASQSVFFLKGDFVDQLTPLQRLQLQQGLSEIPGGYDLANEVAYCLLDKHTFVAAKTFMHKLRSILSVICKGNWTRPTNMPFVLPKEHDNQGANMLYRL